jgi:hypothetical protein
MAPQREIRFARGCPTAMLSPTDSEPRLWLVGAARQMPPGACAIGGLTMFVFCAARMRQRSPSRRSSQENRLLRGVRGVPSGSKSPRMDQRRCIKPMPGASPNTVLHCKSTNVAGSRTLCTDRSVARVRVTFVSARALSDFDSETAFDEWFALNVDQVRIGLPKSSTGDNILFGAPREGVIARESGTNRFSFDWTPQPTDPHFVELAFLLSGNGQILRGTSLWFRGISGLANIPGDTIFESHSAPGPQYGPRDYERVSLDQSQ